MLQALLAGEKAGGDSRGKQAVGLLIVKENGGYGGYNDRALHPYTRALLSAVPVPDPEVKRQRIILSGDIPDPQNPPIGCAFHSRCQQCLEICKNQKPELKEVGKGHMAACHLLNSL